MNAQHLLDKFTTLSPRRRVAVLSGIAIFFLLITVSILLACYYAGKQHAFAAAEDKYLRQRENNLKRIADLEQSAARHLDNERELAAENALLKKQTEAAAEILRANDSRLRGDAAKFTELLEKRNEKLREIDADLDFDNQLCGLCQDARESGFTPFSFCGRCSANP